MNSTCQIAMDQLEHSSQVLNPTPVDDVDDLPFFDKTIQQQLVETAELRKEQKEKINKAEAARDYSSGSSGIFNDKNEQN